MAVNMCLNFEVFSIYYLQIQDSRRLQPTIGQFSSN